MHIHVHMVDSWWKGVTAQKAVFVMLVADASRAEARGSQVLRVSICRRYSQLPSMHGTLDLAFFVATTTTTIDTTDYFTPAAHIRMRDNNRRTRLITLPLPHMRTELISAP